MLQTIGHGDYREEVRIPASARCHRLCLNPIEKAPDARAEVGRAIDNPAGAALEEIVGPDKSICIITDDVTRPTPAELILDVLLPRLAALGAAMDRVTVVIALGSHRRMTEAELLQKLGRRVLRDFRVVQSEFHDPGRLVHVGTTESGVDIRVFDEVMKSDVRIGIGNIAPHGSLGWSGGAKILFPGVTAESTVAQFHLRTALLENPIYGEAENCVRLEVEEWAKRIGLDFIVNTVLCRSGEIHRVVAGDYVKAHRAGVDFAKAIYCVAAPEQVDLVLVDSHPADWDMWQATKGYYPADRLLRDGGTAILVTPCPEGEGPHPEYADMVGNDDFERELEGILERTDFDFDPLALAVGAQVSRMRRRIRLCLYSRGISAATCARAKIHRVENLQAEVDRLCAAAPGGASVAIVECGAEVIPCL